jgi:hypothetical protein
MRNKIKKFIVALFLTTISGVGTLAQKAEPREIWFARGKSSATVEGRLRADQQAEYFIRGKNGQAVALTFNSNAGNRTEVFVFSPATSGEGQSGNKSWEVEFGSEGELRINVSCSRSCRYTLTVMAKKMPVHFGASANRRAQILFRNFALCGFFNSPVLDDL